jgi:uncharacterized protein (DUF1778 family)
METTEMDTKKSQMNVQVTTEAKELARTCATAHQESLNAWVEEAIREKAAKDYEMFNLEQVNKALKRVVKKYMPGKVATATQLMAMARRVAAEDVDEGLVVEQYTDVAARPTKKAASAKNRRRR